MDARRGIGGAAARMKAGIGCTVLARSRATGHGDGISVYTEQLLQHIAVSPQAPELQPVVFGSALGAALPGARILPLPYPAAVGLSAVTGLPFPGNAGLAAELDVFHATDHHIPRLKGVPVVATIMDVIGQRHPEWVNPRLRSLKNRLFRMASGWAEHVVTISDFSADDISACLGIRRERITSIPLGVDEAFHRRVPEAEKQAVLARYGLAPGFFLFVGTLQPRKNVERLLAAHGTLPPALRKAYPLVIVGQDGWRTDHLRPGLAALEAGGCGRWLRYVPRADLFALLQSAHALVFPSLYEGFGLPVLEAFASRLPVVTSGTTSLPEVAGDAALLVDPASVEEIAHAMTRMCEDAALRASLVERGSARAAEFTWRRTAERTAAVYRAFA